MPQTYAAIKRAAAQVGNVYATVRAGLRGEPNAFWACENGHVVGTPFRMRPQDEAELAGLILRFGQSNVIFWAPDLAGKIRVEVQSDLVVGEEVLRRIPPMGEGA